MTRYIKICLTDVQKDVLYAVADFVSMTGGVKAIYRLEEIKIGRTKMGDFL